MGDGEFCVRAARCVSGVKATRLVSLRPGVVIGAVGSSFRWRAGAGVLDVRDEGTGRALLGLDVPALAPRSIALTLSNRLRGLLTSVTSGSFSVTSLTVESLLTVAERGIPLSVALEGDLASEDCPGVFTLMVLARDDLVGVISEATLGFECRLFGPENLGAGIELPSREVGRLLDASSPMFCRARLGATTGSSVTVDRVRLLAAEAGAGRVD